MNAVMEDFFLTGELHVLCQSPALCYSDIFIKNFSRVVFISGQHPHKGRHKDSFFIVGTNWRAVLTQLALVIPKIDSRVIISWVEGSDRETDKRDIDDVLRSSWEMLMVNVIVSLIPEFDNATEINLYTYFPFRNTSRCFDTSAVLVDVWVNSSFARKANLFPDDKVSNLNKCPLRVTSFEDEPQTWIGYRGGKPIIFGFASPLLKEVSLAMNFTIDAQLPTDYAFWGTENSGMFGDLRQNRTDIGFAETPLKAAVVDVSSCNVVSCVTWCVPTKYERPSAWEKLSREFSTLVWILLALNCGFVSCVIWIFSYVVPRETHHMTFINSFTLTISPLVGRGVQFLPISPTVRFIVGHWLLFSLVMSSAYQAGLHTANTIPVSSTRIETLRDLENSNLEIFLSEDMMTLLIQSTVDNPELQIFLQRAKLHKDSVANILEEMSKNGNVATLISQDYCRYFKKKHRSMGVDFPFALHGFTTYCLASPAVGYFSVRHGSPFALKIREYEKRLSESGILDKWLSKVSKRRRKQPEKLKSLTLQSVEPAFIVLLGGVITAVCAFAAERVFDRCIRKREKAKEDGQLVPCLVFYF